MHGRFYEKKKVRWDVVNIFFSFRGIRNKSWEQPRPFRYGLPFEKQATNRSMEGGGAQCTTTPIIRGLRKRQCSGKNSIEEMGAGKLRINIFGVGDLGAEQGR